MELLESTPLTAHLYRIDVGLISAANIAYIGYWSEADVGWTSKVQPSKVRIPTLLASILELLVELLESTPSKVRIPTLLASILE